MKKEDLNFFIMKQSGSLFFDFGDIIVEAFQNFLIDSIEKLQKDENSLLAIEKEMILLTVRLYRIMKYVNKMINNIDKVPLKIFVTQPTINKHTISTLSKIVSNQQFLYAISAYLLNSGKIIELARYNKRFEEAFKEYLRMTFFYHSLN